MRILLGILIIINTLAIGMHLQYFYELNVEYMYKGIFLTMNAICAGFLLGDWK